MHTPPYGHVHSMVRRGSSSNPQPAIWARSAGDAVAGMRVSGCGRARRNAARKRRRSSSCTSHRMDTSYGHLGRALHRGGDAPALDREGDGLATSRVGATAAGHADARVFEHTLHELGADPARVAGGDARQAALHRSRRWELLPWVPRRRHGGHRYCRPVACSVSSCTKLSSSSSSSVVIIRSVDVMTEPASARLASITDAMRSSMVPGHTSVWTTTPRV